MSLPYYTDPTVVTPEEVAEAASGRKRIPDDVFHEVLKWLPVSTSDFLPTRTYAGRKQFLLGYRAQPPFQNTWFVTGGRINWGESPEVACLRQLERELGIKDVSPRFVGHLNVINPESEERPLWHSIWHLFEVTVASDIEIIPNNESLRVQWFESIDPTWPDPVRAALELLGFQ